MPRAVFLLQIELPSSHLIWQPSENNNGTTISNLYCIEHLHVSTQSYGGVIAVVKCNQPRPRSSLFTYLMEMMRDKGLCDILMIITVSG